MLIVSATQTFLFFSAVWWTIMHCNGVKCVASCNTMYQNYQDPSLPSGSDILRYIWTCRASALYDMPINWRYIQKRCPALPDTLILKKFGPGKLLAKKVWAQNIFIDFLAELDRKKIFYFIFFIQSRWWIKFRVSRGMTFNPICSH